MDTWFDLKKDTALLERYFERQLLVMRNVLRHGEKTEGFPVFDFNDHVNDVQVALNRTQATLSRLGNLHHYYSSIKNDRLNRNIYALTPAVGDFSASESDRRLFWHEHAGFVFRRTCRRHHICCLPVGCAGYRYGDRPARNQTD